MAIHGTLDVGVIEARDLQNRDWIGKSDPFVIVTFGSQTHRTYTIQNNTKNPTWHNEGLHCKVKEDVDEIIVDVLDEDLSLASKSAFLGQVRLRLGDYSDGKLVDDWFELKDRGKGVKEDGNVTGSIHLHIQYTHTQLGEFLSKFNIDEIEEERAQEEDPPLDGALLSQNVSDFAQLIAPVLDFYKLQVSLWKWEDSSQSIVGFAVYLFFSMYPTMLPVILPLAFVSKVGFNYVRLGGKRIDADDEAEEEAHEESREKTKESGGFLGLGKTKRKLRKVQNTLGKINRRLDRLYSAFDWKDPKKTKVAMIGVCCASVAWLITPFRWTMFAATLFLYTRHTAVYMITKRLYAGLYRMYDDRYGAPTKSSGTATPTKQQ